MIIPLNVTLVLEIEEDGSFPDVILQASDRAEAVLAYLPWRKPFEKWFQERKIDVTEKGPIRSVEATPILANWNPRDVMYHSPIFMGEWCRNPNSL